MDLRRVTLGLLVAVLAANEPLEGAFFMRLRGTTMHQLQTMGGHTLYQTDARVNGVPASLHVLGFSTTSADLRDELGRLWQLPPATGQGPAWITRGQRGRTQYLLILPGTRDAGATVWLIEPKQANTDLHASTIPAAPGPDWCPAGAIRFWVVNERTRSLLAIYHADDAPGSVLSAATARLTAAGWSEMVQTDELVLFARDSRGAVAYATSPGPGESTRLAVFIQGP